MLNYFRSNHLNLFSAVGVLVAAGCAVLMYLRGMPEPEDVNVRPGPFHYRLLKVSQRGKTNFQYELSAKFEIYNPTDKVMNVDVEALEKSASLKDEKGDAISDSLSIKAHEFAKLSVTDTRDVPFIFNEAFLNIDKTGDDVSKVLNAQRLDIFGRYNGGSVGSPDIACKTDTGKTAALASDYSSIFIHISSFGSVRKTCVINSDAWYDGQYSDYSAFDFIPILN